MTSLFSGIDYPRRHVASLTDFPSAFQKKLHTCASLPESTQPRLLLCTSKDLQVGRQWDPELWCRDNCTSSPVPKAAEVARASSRPACFGFVKSVQLHVEDQPTQKQSCQ